MKLNNVIQETTDYSIFKYMEHNRHVRHAHVLKLMVSFKKRPSLRPARPILLNEKYEIVDGQHRLEASKRMGISVYFMVVPGLTIADARLLNALQRTWTLIDYADSYAGDNYPAYQLYLELREKFPIPPASMLIYMTRNQSGRVSANFKVGIFEPDSVKEITARLKKLEDFEQYAPTYWKEAAFSLAVFNLISHPEYEHERMLKMLEKNTLTRQPSRIEYLRIFEDIYNTRMGIGSRTRFL